MRILITKTFWTHTTYANHIRAQNINIHKIKHINNKIFF